VSKCLRRGKRLLVDLLRRMVQAGVNSLFMKIKTLRNSCKEKVFAAIALFILCLVDSRDIFEAFTYVKKCLFPKHMSRGHTI